MLTILLSTSEHGFTDSSRMITADLLPSEYDAFDKNNVFGRYKLNCVFIFDNYGLI